ATAPEARPPLPEPAAHAVSTLFVNEFALETKLESARAEPAAKSTWVVGLPLLLESVSPTTKSPKTAAARVVLEIRPSE
ncbi:hypothetical protein ACC692_36710, partial [Rhizobium ruizarguesonis]